MLKALLVALALGLGLGLSPVGAGELLPNGEQTFADANGDPLAAGSVYFYVPNTSTLKDTWFSPTESAPNLNTNPVVLDAAGRAVIYGSGSYRQVVKDSLGVTIWDELTNAISPTVEVAWGGTSSGSANTQTLTASDFTSADGQLLVFIAGFTNTAAMTVNPNASGAIDVHKATLSGSTVLNPGDVTAGNLVALIFDGTNLNLVNPSQQQFGIKTNLTSATTTDLGSISSHNINITSTTPITSFGSSADTKFPLYYLTFAGILTLTHNATSLILPDAQNITTAAGNTGLAEYLGSGNWRIRQFTGASGSATVGTPGGRLTLTTLTPVMAADVTTSSSVYYTPYMSNTVPVWNGSSFSSQTFSQLTVTLVAGHLANSNYDVFVASDAGTLRACTGPVWTSDTGRGTGAGTTEISRAAGLLTNSNSMTCVYSASSFTVAAGYGLYVGTFRTSASVGDTLWTANPAAAVGGGNPRLFVWNMYNRVYVTAKNLESTNSWNYTSDTGQMANASASNRISLIRGLNEDSSSVSASEFATRTTAGGMVYSAVALDSTSFPSTAGGNTFTGTNNAIVPSGQVQNAVPIPSGWSGLQGLGYHYHQLMERSEQTANTTTWYGDTAAGAMYISLETRM